jgi:hypothetical protein
VTSPAGSLQGITEADIAHFLANNPAFFERHAELLGAIQLTSPHGQRAVSLQERQMEMLRERIKGLEMRIVEMIRHGQENLAIADRIHRTTRRVVRTLRNWRRGLETPPTQPSVCCSWFLQLRHGFTHGRAIEKVRNHFSAWSNFALIIDPRGIQKVVQARVMNSVNWVNAPLRWCKKLHGLVGLQHLANVFGSSGVFVR